MKFKVVAYEEESKYWVTQKYDEYVGKNNFLTLKELEATFNKQIPVIVYPAPDWGSVIMCTKWNSRNELMTQEYGSHSVYKKEEYGKKWTARYYTFGGV